MTAERMSRRERWLRLTPRQRAVLVSHRPDELEREEAIALGVRADLEEAFGASLWDETLARIDCNAEPDPPTQEVDGFEVQAMTLDEVGQELGGLSRESVRKTEQTAMNKLRRHPVIRELAGVTESDEDRERKRADVERAIGAVERKRADAERAIAAIDRAIAACVKP